MFNFFGSYDKNQVKNHKNQFNWNLFNRKWRKEKTLRAQRKFWIYDWRLTNFTLSIFLILKQIVNPSSWAEPKDVNQFALGIARPVWAHF